ncbi:SDR family oxidoreductase [Bradyrhizobium sp. 17-4]
MLKYSARMKVLVFGLGYSALHISYALQRAGCEVTATVRSRAKAIGLIQARIAARVFSSDHIDEQIAEDVRSSDAVLVSVPPGECGDPVLESFSGYIAEASKLRWVGYLSTVAVYGDQAGGWVDERTATEPGKGRSRLRVHAEKDWLALGSHVFRLAGIYGPGRNQLAQLAAGTARRIIKPGQVFNRIHVADIVAVIEASLAKPRPGGIYNVCDNEPAPPQDVVEYASKLCGLDPPPGIPFEKADLSPMARSFYNENRRVRNALIREELGVNLNYPTYREGLAALRASGEGPGQ